MRLSRTDLVPVLAIIASGAVGLAISASVVLSSRSDQVLAPVPVVVPFVTSVNRAIVLNEQTESQRNILHLIIQPTGIVDVMRGESTQIQQMRAEQIEGLWRQAVRSNPNLIAAVKAHPRVPYRYMVDVLHALQDANARISLRVLEN